MQNGQGGAQTKITSPTTGLEANRLYLLIWVSIRLAAVSWGHCDATWGCPCGTVSWALTVLSDLGSFLLGISGLPPAGCRGSLGWRGVLTDTSGFSSRLQACGVGVTCGLGVDCAAHRDPTLLHQPFCFVPTANIQF